MQCQSFNKQKLDSEGQLKMHKNCDIFYKLELMFTNTSQVYHFDMI